VIAVMIAVSKMVEALTMTMHMTKGGAKEEDAVHCPVATAVAASPCPSPPCMPHPLPLPSWWRGRLCGQWHGQWQLQLKTTIIIEMEGGTSIEG
jgi:hypothetical protein